MYESFDQNDYCGLYVTHDVFFVFLSFKERFLTTEFNFQRDADEFFRAWNSCGLPPGQVDQLWVCALKGPYMSTYVLLTRVLYPVPHQQDIRGINSFFSDVKLDL